MCIRDRPAKPEPHARDLHVFRKETVLANEGGEQLFGLLRILPSDDEAPLQFWPGREVIARGPYGAPESAL
eukprot:15190101-Alexandrium_andersonii.AAC.1